jgi:hypothetical protein
MKKNTEKDFIFIILIPVLFISIITVVGFIPSATGINEKVKEMFIYDECCSYIEDSQSHSSTLLIFSSFLENQIK